MGTNIKILNGTKIVRYSKCNCGAITLWFNNGASNSMRMETFKKLGLDLSEAEEFQTSYCCDHCVNHYGIDLCECGSGELVGKCDCGSNKAHDILGVKFDSFSAILKAFNISVYG